MFKVNILTSEISLISRKTLQIVLNKEFGRNKNNKVFSIDFYLAK